MRAPDPLSERLRPYTRAPQTRSPTFYALVMQLGVYLLTTDAALHTHRDTPIPHMRYEREKRARTREREKRERDCRASVACISCVCMYQLRMHLSAAYAAHTSCFMPIRQHTSAYVIRQTSSTISHSLSLSLARAPALSYLIRHPHAHT